MKTLLQIVWVALMLMVWNNLLLSQDSKSIVDKKGYFKVTNVAHNVWQFTGKSTENIYLVVGEDSALVIDAGLVGGDFMGIVKSITKLPLIMVNTHGHGDHVGYDYLFSKIYAHPADFDMIKRNFPPQKRKELLDALKDDASFTKDDIAFLKTNSMKTLESVKEGYVFDLGDRKLKVIETPGHTKGSICLLDEGNKLLFTGDHCNAIVWLFLSECLPLDIYLESLKKVEKMQDKYNLIMPGHNQPLDKTYMSELTTGVEHILNGTCTPEPYIYGNFKATLCKFKTASIVYDTKKLRSK